MKKDKSKLIQEAICKEVGHSCNDLGDTLQCKRCGWITKKATPFEKAQDAEARKDIPNIAVRPLR